MFNVASYCEVERNRRGGAVQAAGSSVEDGAAMAEVLHEVMSMAFGELLHLVGETRRYYECSRGACGGMHAPRIPVGWTWSRRALVHVLAP